MTETKTRTSAKTENHGENPCPKPLFATRAVTTPITFMAPVAVTNACNTATTTTTSSTLTYIIPNPTAAPITVRPLVKVKECDDTLSRWDTSLADLRSPCSHWR
jgi:hypothetical protein